MDIDNNNRLRPSFPKRAVVTAGMPYGNKELHLGHIGGVFIHADVFARFLRDRIGAENVLFVSGTDCYGSPIVESYRMAQAAGEFTGSIEEFVAGYHEKQKQVLQDYGISLDLFAASALGRPAEIHRGMSEYFMRRLYEKGLLRKISTMQFYDAHAGTFLNGRQVTGICPVQGCRADKAYADECAAGHQYMPQELINPRSALSGERPEMREVSNWYFDLEVFRQQLAQWHTRLTADPAQREFMVKYIGEYLEPPVVYVRRESLEQAALLEKQLPGFRVEDDPAKASLAYIFNSVLERERACALFAANNVRYRTGKTLVPFRLTGNIEWGVPAPEIDGLSELTFWVWPESLWAPLSFTAARLEQLEKQDDEWKKWWASRDSVAYQFIGEDNVYFYGPAEMALFMGMQPDGNSASPSDGELQLPEIIANCHVLFLDRKASSSDAVKPPTAAQLLEHYTAEQLRSHFLGMGLGIRSVKFQPKPFNPAARPQDNDPALKEGGLLTNVFNRIARSCFYTAQKYFDGRIPGFAVSESAKELAENAALDYEMAMSRREFHAVTYILDSFVREINKIWARDMRRADSEGDDDLRQRTLVDGFYLLRIATVLLHPLAPQGTEKIAAQLKTERGNFWNWDTLFEGLEYFISDPENHRPEHLPPRTDFFTRHHSQQE